MIPLYSPCSQAFPGDVKSCAEESCWSPHSILLAEVNGEGLREAEEARMRELGLEITEEVSLRLMLHFIQFCYFRADFWALLS